MKRTPLNERLLPNYTETEELCNMLTHIIGIILGVIVLTCCVAKASVHDYMPGIITGAFFGASMITLYTISSVYHGWKKGYAKKFLQVLDHCTIYLLIFGSFVPICLTHLYEENPKVSLLMLLIVGVGSLFGIIFTAIDLHKYKILSMVGYLAPWFAFFVRHELSAVYPSPFLTYIVVGGILYTIGAVLYMVGSKKVHYMHTVFHIFIVLGSFTHFLAIYQFCM